MQVRFAGFRLDTHARRLCRGTRDVHLPPKAFELLCVLLEHRERALSKDELIGRLWPGVFVSDAGLARVVTDVRHALGDRARRARIVRTVHGHGYAFIAPIELEVRAMAARRSAAPAHWLTSSDRTFPLADGECLVGRDPASTIWLDSPKVSRRHARLIVSGDRVTIEDLGAKNGTSVRGTRLAGPVQLYPGDEVRVGPFTLTFRASRRGATTETEIER